MNNQQELSPVMIELIIIGIEEKRRSFFELINQHLEHYSFYTANAYYPYNHAINEAVKILIELEHIENSAQDPEVQCKAKNELEKINMLLKPKVKKELMKNKKHQEEEIAFKECEVWAVIENREAILTIEEDGEELYNQYLQVRDGLVKHGLLIQENGEYKFNPDHDDIPF